MRMQITHITQDDFLAAFLEVYNESMTSKTYQQALGLLALLRTTQNRSLNALIQGPLLQFYQPASPSRVLNTSVGQRLKSHSNAGDTQLPAETATQTAILRLVCYIDTEDRERTGISSFQKKSTLISQGGPGAPSTRTEKTERWIGNQQSSRQRYRRISAEHNVLRLCRDQASLKEKVKAESMD